MYVYLIKEAWGDGMENHPSRAFGYKTIGAVLDKQTAEAYCAEHAEPVTSEKFGYWPAMVGSGEMTVIYEEVPILDIPLAE